jgi:predicted 2-oxoglutarate/Fe(II)-dependent dioxygenase YbiX
MVEPEFLGRFGIFVAREFLDDSACRQVREEMSLAASKIATVGASDGNGDEDVDEDYRRTKMAQVSGGTRARIRERLLVLKSDLEASFSVQLGPCQTPQFLIYREGDFFRPHTDNQENPESPDWLKERTLSLVVFLNDQSDDAAEDGFSGGSLNFYGLLGQGRGGEMIGLPLEARAGLLVAFRSDVVHGVSEVTRGRRFTVVSWFSEAHS